MKPLSKLLRAALLTAALATSAPNYATTSTTNLTDMWGITQESGWGLFIDQQGDVLLGTFFIYDKFGVAKWYTVQWRITTIGPGSNGYTGTLYETSGPAFSQVPYDRSS